MEGSRHRYRLKAAIAGALVIGLSGCITYDMETTLNPDGSGQRSVTVKVEDPHRIDDLVTPQDFVEFMSLTEKEGWDHELSVGSNGDSVHFFRHQTSIRDQRSWSELNDQVHIIGTTPAYADSTLGNVTLGDVHFRNRATVRSWAELDGSMGFHFQESFTWERGLDVVIEGLVEGMDRWIGRTYPNLSGDNRAEIRGVARTSLFFAIEDGLLDTVGEEDDLAWGELLDRITSLAFKTIRTKHPEATESALRAGLDLLSDESGEDRLEDLNRLLPGLSEGGDAEITFRLTMPGEVTSTNAHERDGETLVWVFTPWDAMTTPVVLVAESMVGGR